MNLAAYDIVKTVNRNATWIDPKYKKLYSREISPRNFFGFSKNFNPDDNTYTIHLILVDNNPNDGSFVRVIDKFKPMKIPLNRIWCDIQPNIQEATNINIIHVEHTDDGDIYKLDI